MRIRAIDVLQRITGAHRAREKVEACGYQCYADLQRIEIRDGEVVVATLDGGGLRVRSDISLSVAGRELSEDQWFRYLELDRERIAVHEAGHAIIACRDSLGLAHVVLADDDQWGETCFALPASELPSDHSRNNRALMHQFYAAGAAAEVVVWGLFNPHGVAGDQQEFDKLNSSDGARPSFGSVVRQVSEALDETAIWAVANSLAEAGYLSTRRVERLLSDQSRGSDGMR